jgi:hypothetical protein
MTFITQEKTKKNQETQSLIHYPQTPPKKKQERETQKKKYIYIIIWKKFNSHLFWLNSHPLRVFISSITSAGKFSSCALIGSA